MLLKGLSCLRRAAKLLRDCDATDVEVSELVRDVVVVEFHCVVGRPIRLALALVLITIRSTLLGCSGCSRAALPRSVGKGLADRAVAGLCVYWCSRERASVREFMLVVSKLWF